MITFVMRKGTIVQKFAIYELKKLAGKKEYIVSSYTVFRSLPAAYRELDARERNQGKPALFNNKIREYQYYVGSECVVFVPNWTIVKNKNGVEERRLLGVYGRFPIFYLDEYPNPYSSFKLYKLRGRNELVLKRVK